MIRIFTIFAIALLLATIIAPSTHARPKPPEKYLKKQPVDENYQPPQVAAIFYYWYDYKTKAQIDGPDPILRHPVRFDNTFSYENDSWYIGEFADMADAGIDIALAAYSGHGLYPEHEPWSRTGLGHMAAVLDYLDSTGKPHPKLGMHFDTSSLLYEPGSGVDIKNRPNFETDEGKELFFLTIKSFFDHVPEQHRAKVDGKPLVWLTSRLSTFNVDETLFPDLRARFLAEFGVAPYIVAENSWKGAGVADATYYMGSAITGSKQGDGVITLSPGLGTHIPGASTAMVDRLNGLLYEWAWLEALNSDAEIVGIESWNQLHVGTEICETRELGRQYIDITAFFTELIKLPFAERRYLTDELLTLYHGTVTMEPAVVTELNLTREWVEFPARVEAKTGPIFGSLRWNNNNSGVKIDPLDDNFILKKGELIRLDYTIEALDESVMMGPLPYLTGDFAAAQWHWPISIRLEPSIIRLIESWELESRDGIVIDGNLSDWEGIEPYVISDAANVAGPAAPVRFENTGAGNPGWSESDAVFAVYTCWDIDNLYLAIVTNDDIPLDGNRGRNILEGDCIQVAFEFDDDRNGYLDYEADFSFAVTYIGDNDEFRGIHRPRSTEGPLDRLIRHSTTRTGNATIYEFSIPRDQFGVDKHDWEMGYTMGFNVVMHDNDGDEWEGCVQLAPGLVYGESTKRYARIMLMEE